MSLNWELLQGMLVAAITCSVITVAFIQKTKQFFKSSNWIIVYSLFVNLILGFFFVFTFTDLRNWLSVWVGLFSFIGADTIYKGLEGKLASYSELVASDEEAGSSTVNEGITDDFSNPISPEIIGEIEHD